MTDRPEGTAMRSRGRALFYVVALLTWAAPASASEKVILDDDFGGFSPT